MRENVEPRLNASAETLDCAANSGPAIKTCNRCGRDLTKQVRYRDEAGYWCVKCSKADKNAYRASHLPCDDCGADVKRGQEIVLEDRRLCDVCGQKRHTQTLRRQLQAQENLQAEYRSQRRRRAIRTWMIVAAELIAAGAILVGITRLSSPDRASSADPAVERAKDQGVTVVRAIADSKESDPHVEP